MTLMVMVLMSIAGLALLRAVDNNTLVADNIGYKQAAIIASDSAIKSATDWLTTTALVADDAPNGAYATDAMDLDWTGQNTSTSADDVNWDGTSSAPTAAKQVTFSNGSTTDVSGNQAYYVIHRLCDTAGPAGALGTSCATSHTQAAATGSTKAGTAYGQKPLTTTTQVYYRVTVKVIGPKNTISYSQVFVLI
jgi:Tfp pilus assembly protein PilX